MWLRLDAGPLVGWALLQCYIWHVSTLTEIEAAADALPKEQKEQLLAFLAAKLGRDSRQYWHRNIRLRTARWSARGCWEVAQDFDAQLPDEFWLGRDAVKLLLDTHAFIWWDGEQSKLSAAALDACQSPTNSLHLSLAIVSGSCRSRCSSASSRFASRSPMCFATSSNKMDYFWRR